jgi:ABC-type transport system involved in cytochrome bd biosynthesis fused ATPase/permease subunit
MRDDSNSGVAKLIALRGNRTTAVMLSWLEENVYQYLPADLQSKTRQQVLDQINGFKDLAIDIVKSDTAAINEVWAEKIDEIHAYIEKN